MAHVIEQRLRILRLPDDSPAPLLFQQEAQTEANPGLGVSNQDIQTMPDICTTELCLPSYQENVSSSLCERRPSCIGVRRFMD